MWILCGLVRSTHDGGNPAADTAFMTVIVTPPDDLPFRFAVACAIDRIAAALGLRPAELAPSGFLAAALEAELRERYDSAQVAIGDGLVVTRDRGSRAAA